MDDITPGEDFISNLPNDVLGKILCPLTTKEAIRTCVLSKSWVNNWNLVISKVFTADLEFQVENTCIFSCSLKCGIDFFSSEIAKMIPSFNNSVIETLGSNHVKKLHLTPYNRNITVPFETLLSSLLSYNVEINTISISRAEKLIHEDISLPENLLSFASVKSLAIRMPCTLEAPLNTSLPNLTTLHLYQIEIHTQNPDAWTLHFSLPKLKRLYLLYSKWLNVKCVEFYVPMLTEIQSRTSHEFECDNCIIKIVAAKLIKHIDMCGNVRNFDATKSRVSFARLENCSVKSHDARDLLRGFASVEKLELAGYLMRGIERSKPGLPIIEFHRLEHLIMLEYMPNVSLPLELLHAMPLLKVLEMNMNSRIDDYNHDEMDCVPSCLAHSLEKVKFQECTGDNCQRNLPKYVLKNGLKLKDVKFYTRYLAKISEVEVVKTYPRGSATLEVYVL